MEIIFGRENAEKLRGKYTVLDLETLPAADGQLLEAFCVISADKLNLSDLPYLAEWVTEHNKMLTLYHTKAFDDCVTTLQSLMGKFGGEVDSFYTVISDRILESSEYYDLPETLSN